MKILVTGGAGFIGSHITDALVKDYEVTTLDNLCSNEGKIPSYINKQAKFLLGDVRDGGLLKKIVPEFDYIFHEAASVGIAQSNYEISPFADNNMLGTAKLLQAIVESKKHPKLIISASNTTYGEGLYSCKCGTFHPEIRTQEQIDKYGFEPYCEKCNSLGKPIPTPENTELHCNSIYAYTKKSQEEFALFLGKLYDFPVTLLKCFNVFGPRQSLSNPYTGVSAIFMSRVKNGNIPTIYEDGKQTRDFISIHDVVEANLIALDKKTDNQLFNVGSGNPIKISSLAEEICKLYNREPKIEINGKYRKGDIRHCVADNSKIKLLGWTPKVSFLQGLKEIYEWSLDQQSEDKFEQANRELQEKGLI